MPPEPRRVAGGTGDGVAKPDSVPSRLHGKPLWLLGRAAHEAGRVTQARLLEIGLRRYTYAILAALEESGPGTQAEIGRRLGVDPSDMVAAVNDLEGERLVTRERDPRDRRRNIVTSTSAGRARLRKVETALAAAEDEFLAGLTAAERELLVDLLRRVAAAGRAVPRPGG